MSHVFHQLYYHFVWSTKDRLDLLEGDFGRQAVEMVEAACRKRDVMPLACNAMPNHVHLLVTLPPTIAPSTFVGEIKGAVAYTFNQKFGKQRYLKWQDGYGVVSIRAVEKEKVIRYIEDQHEIHASRKLSKLLEADSN